MRKELIQQRSRENAPYKKEFEFCEEKIMELEEELELENEKLIKASESGDNAMIIELSQKIGKIQDDIDGLFERLEIASEALDEVEERYAPN